MTRLLSILALILSISLQAADRPNVVFIVSEDNSHHYLDLFFEGGAKTPNIAALAEHGLIFPLWNFGACARAHGAAEKSRANQP